MVSAAASLPELRQDLPYCFNRKEVKDHGEGGSMVGGTSPRTWRRDAIVEDVVTVILPCGSPSPCSKTSPT